MSLFPICFNVLIDTFFGAYLDLLPQPAYASTHRYEHAHSHTEAKSKRPPAWLPQILRFPQPAALLFSFFFYLKLGSKCFQSLPAMIEQKFCLHFVL